MTIKVIVNSAVKIRTRFFTEASNSFKYVRVAGACRQLNKFHRFRHCYNICNAIVTLN